MSMTLCLLSAKRQRTIIRQLLHPGSGSGILDFVSHLSPRFYKQKIFNCFMKRSWKPMPCGADNWAYCKMEFSCFTTQSLSNILATHLLCVVTMSVPWRLGFEVILTSSNMISQASQCMLTLYLPLTGPYRTTRPWTLSQRPVNACPWQKNQS